MGLILGRFRKKKSTLEQLDKIDTDIKSIEAFRLNTEIAQKRIVGHFILVSAGIYILVAIVFYFYFFPATFYDQIFYITPLLLVPFIIWGVKRLLTWYYRRKISRNETKLSTLRSEKRKLLDHVMDTETYKIAKTILEKYAPDQMKKTSPSFEVTPFKGTPANLRARIPPKTPINPPKTPSNQLVRVRALSTPQVQQIPPQIQQMGLMSTNGNQENKLVIKSGMSPLPLPREILPRDRSVLDKMVEYLVGDGPSNRFALICKNCQSHNGMALKEEFEYFAFRCCYCYTFNPARKLRPAAPKLLESPPGNRRRNSSTSSSEKNSEPDSEIEEKHEEKQDLKMEQGDGASSPENPEISEYPEVQENPENPEIPEILQAPEKINKSDEEKKDD